MGRTLIIAALMALLLAGCGGEKQQAADPPSASVSVTSAPPSPVAPVMPALAKEHTEAGAKAFAAYYWEVVNYAQQTLNTAALRALANPACAGCNRGVGAIEKIKTDSGAIEGGDVAPTVLSAKPAATATARLMSLRVRVHVDAMTVTYPSPRPMDSFSASTATDFFIISERPSGWWVETIEVVK